MANLVRRVHDSALNCRRDQPTPVDFAIGYYRCEVPINSLPPHRRQTFPFELLPPPARYSDERTEHGTLNLPILSAELNDQSARASSAPIPEGFPLFPSIHTYRFTPSTTGPGHQFSDPGAIREAAAKSAKEGEDALRKLSRAAKVRTQKEARALADRDAPGRERFKLWDAAMNELLQEMASGSESTGAAADPGDLGTVINSEAVFFRREVGRGGKRAGAGALAG